MPPIIKTERDTIWEDDDEDIYVLTDVRLEGDRAVAVHEAMYLERWLMSTVSSS